MNFQPFLEHLAEQDFNDWATALPAQITAAMNPAKHGDIPRWANAVNALPELTTNAIQLNQSRISANGNISDEEAEQLHTQLQALHPWRKGPYELFGTHIDTEWRSDWKWDRLAPYIGNLHGHQVLDVGCGNGYHCWRMRGAGAATVVGIDPSPLFVMQFFAAQKYLQDPAVGVLPIGVEQLPANLKAFDTVFSMGVLYHRKSPIEHLLTLRDALVPGGQLVLETLVIEGSLGEVLTPEGRYAQMNNVWFIPSVDTLMLWLRKTRFTHVRYIDENTTSLDEQRSTDWMRFHSLEQFLDSADHSKTVEGHPAPRRAVIVANSPV